MESKKLGEFAVVFTNTANYWVGCDVFLVFFPLKTGLKSDSLGDLNMSTFLIH